jgi:hypothetical protein
VQCQQRESLTEAYRKCIEQLSTVVMKLTSAQGTPDFNAAYRESEAIRLECDRARTALEEHRTRHGC